MYYKGIKHAKLQAHRGVSTEFPENTMPAFEAAVLQGYDTIELDPGYTADGHIVILHDNTLNRTARKKDGSLINETTYVHKLTLSELADYDFGISFSEAFRGTKIPTFEEVLCFSKKHNIPIKIDNKIQRFYPEELDTLFSLIKEYGAESLAQFTCTDLYFMDHIISNFPSSPVHYDGYVDRWHMEQIKKSLKDNKLTTWLRYDNPTSAWCKMPPINDETVTLAKKYGEVGVWILSENEEADISVEKFDVDIIETTGSIKPNK